MKLKPLGISRYKSPIQINNCIQCTRNTGVLRLVVMTIIHKYLNVFKILPDLSVCSHIFLARSKDSVQQKKKEEKEEEEEEENTICQ